MLRYILISFLLTSPSWSLAQAPSIANFGSGQIGLTTLSPQGLMGLTFDLLYTATEPLGNIPALAIPGLEGTPLAPVGALTQLGSSAIVNLGDTLGIVENLAIPTARGLAPVVTILLDDPATVVEYLLTGGTILAPELAIPSIPLISTPLPQFLTSF
jgi:hypothetical protein